MSGTILLLNRHQLPKFPDEPEFGTQPEQELTVGITLGAAASCLAVVMVMERTGEVERRAQRDFHRCRGIEGKAAGHVVDTRLPNVTCEKNSVGVSCRR